MKKWSSITIFVLVIGAVCMYPHALLAQPQQDDQHEEELLNFIKEVNPSMVEHLQRVRAINPAEYRQILGGVANQYLELKKLEATNPEAAQKAIEVAKLEGQAQVLANQYKGTTSSQEREELRKRIKAILPQAIEGKIALEELRVAAIEKDIKTLKDRTAQRKQNKDKIVEQKLAEITSEDYLRW